MQINPTKIKDRLDTKLNDREKFIVKEALIWYLKDKDPKVERITKDNLLIEDLLPYLQKLHPTWYEMEPRLFVTSYKAIESVYHTSRNQFKNMQSLRINVDAYIIAKDESEDTESHLGTAQNSGQKI